MVCIVGTAELQGEIERATTQHPGDKTGDISCDIRIEDSIGDATKILTRTTPP